MTRAEIIEEAREILDEPSETILTSLRAYRAFNRVVSDWSAGVGCLVFGRKISARTGLSHYAPPDFAVGLVNVTSNVAAGNSVTVNSWSYTVLAGDLQNTTDVTRKVAGVIYSKFLESTEYTVNKIAPMLRSSWVLFVNPARYFSHFSADGGLQAYTATAIPHSVRDVVWIGSTPVQLRKIKEFELLKRDPAWDSSPKIGVPSCWTEIDGHIVITPAPANDGELLVYSSYFHPIYPMLGTDDAPLLFPDSHKQGLIYGLVAEFATILRDREGVAPLIALYRQMYEIEKGKAIMSVTDNIKLSTAWEATKWQE